MEDIISAESEAFKASILSLIVIPLPKKEAANPDRLPPFVVPISGDKVTSTVYCFGILMAIIIPIISPIPAAL